MTDGNIEYTDSNSAPARRVQAGGGLAGLLIRYGAAKDEAQANKVLIGILIVAIVIGAGAWFVF